MKQFRSVRFAPLPVALVCMLALAGCRHHASQASPANQTAASNAATATPASANPQAQPADANAQAQPAPAQTHAAPAQAQNDSSQPAAGPTQSAASNSTAQPAAPVAPAQQAQSAPAPQSSQSDQNSQNSQDGGAAPADSAQNQPPQQNPPPQQPESPQLTIPRGTRVDIRLIDAVGSRRSVTGQRFTATLDAPIVVGKTVVAPRGANVTGRVVYAKRSGRLKGPAELTLTLTSVEVSGQRYAVVTNPRSWGGKSHKRHDAGWIGGGAGGGALVGAAAGGGVGAAIGAGVGAGGGTVTAFITGRKDINLPSETRLRFVLRKSASVGSVRY
jgi:hypothetical protein